MAHGDCLVLLPCVTHGEAEAHRCCGWPEFSQGVRGHSWPPAQDVHYARFWAGWSPVGSRTRGAQRQTDWRALGDRSGGSMWTVAPGSPEESSQGPPPWFFASHPLEPCSPQELWPCGLMVAGQPVGFLWQTHCPVSQPPVEEPHPHCPAHTGLPGWGQAHGISQRSVWLPHEPPPACGECESEDLEPALGSPLTLTRSLFQ